MKFDFISPSHKYLNDVLYIIRQGITEKKTHLKKGLREGLNTQTLVDTFNIIGTSRLDNKKWIGVQKEHENISSTAREDIYFYLNDDNYTRIFYAEAKRLPKYKTLKDDEYVIGDNLGPNNKTSGGIERYKVAIHGRDDIKKNGMIAFVENQSIIEWLKLVNDKISKFYPDDSLLLKCDNEHEFISAHKYADESKGIFEMHHFWIPLL